MSTKTGTVQVGNPPYSVGQESANDLNANIKYPHLDARIAETYAARSTATNKNSLYDSYLRAFRWATDRIGNTGIVAFVSNGGWIDSNTADGIRLTLADEYSHIYVYNLRGNARTAGELRKKERGNVFGSGGRTTIGIVIGVKNPAQTGPCEISYRDIGDYLTREDKLRIVADADLTSIDWTPIAPNTHGDWINQRDDTFTTWPAIGAKKAEPGQVAVFRTFSMGLNTAKDAWCQNFSKTKLQANIEVLLTSVNSAASEFATHLSETGGTRSTGSEMVRFLDGRPDLAESKSLKWSRNLINSAARYAPMRIAQDGLRFSSYRPFTPQWTYFDRRVNDMVYRLDQVFPTSHHTNIGFYVVGTGSAKPFSVLMTTTLPDLSFWGSGSGQYFPRWTYEKVTPTDGGFDLANGADVDEYGYRRVDNITEEVLSVYRQAVGPQVNKDDIFYYVYGQLHDPHYRISYAADLKKMLPHIPIPESQERFETVADAGRRLSELHTNFEKVEPYPLSIELKKGTPAEDRETWRVSKMKWARVRDEETGKLVNDPTTLIYNAKVTITGIPAEADDYMLGSRSALSWILERYQVKIDKPSGIVNDPNDWCDEVGNPRHIIDLICRVTTVAMETNKLVNSLWDLETE
ncbi:type ISP restriction/modification enzyme [Arthrobacter koreensis]|uniref:type ISP restriction/modification enzyme n=1 Tax=Arthrobacter koreensis TaxID=199136 RepID=UPI00366B16A7